MARRLILVRHGEVAAEYAGRFLGSTDVALSPAGQEQARQLGARLQGMAWDRCWCSPLQRARQTAALALPEAEIEVKPNLREVDFGKWEAMTFDEIRSEDPRSVDAWAAFSSDFCFPAGESLASFLARIESVAAGVKDAPEDAILMITHGGVVRALVCNLLGLRPDQYVCFAVKCGSLTTIDIAAGKGVLVGLNDRHHLAQEI